MNRRQHEPQTRGLRRRILLKGALAVTGAACLPVAIAAPEDVDAAITELFGNRTPQAGKVAVKIPPISENGYSVPLSVKVDSPMTAQDHVVRIAVFAEENPIALVANFELGPRAGVASIQSRIRMGGSQRIRAVAEMSDGSLWWGYAFSIVTLAACVV